VNQELFAVKLKDVDEKLNHFKDRLDAEIKTIGAALKAAHTVFDQTNVRADEIIKSAERRRAGLTVALSAIGTIIAVLGFLGYKGALNLWEYTEAIRKDRDRVAALTLAVSHDAEETKKRAAAAEEVYRSIDEARRAVADKVLFPGFLEELRRKGDVITFYTRLKNLDPPDLTFRLLGEIEKVIVQQSERDHGDYTNLLKMIVKDAREPKEKISGYYLLLANHILLNKTFDPILLEFEKYVREHKDQRLEKRELASLDELFAKESREKREAFRRVRELIPTR
jgi:hypothetical protein